VNIEEFRDYCLAKKGVTEHTPFPMNYDVLVFKVMGKMFTATDMTTFESFSIKCVPETIEELRDKYHGLKEPSHFSKKHWSSAIVNSDIPDKILYEFLDISYDLVVKNMPKKWQAELDRL